jgi:adenine-specific DNA-methyltransferase
MRRQGAKKSKAVQDYRHEEATRLNNPPAGLAWQDTDQPRKHRFEYDPHLDPELIWAGKTEHGSFTVEAPSIHVHERLSTEAIIRALQKKPPQPTLFEDPELDRSKIIEFYQHEMGWVNRFVLGDSLLVMASLLERERMAGQVQMIYLDPPYAINYNSNFQAHISNRRPNENKDESITREPEQIQAYRDTWEQDVHSYLTYLRDRLLLCHQLMTESGSIFVQINDLHLAYVRLLLDEIFGARNFVALIPFRKKTMPLGGKLLEQMDDFLLWYAKDKNSAKYRQLYVPQSVEGDWHYQWAELPDGSILRLTKGQVRNHSLLPDDARVFRLKSLEPSGPMPSGYFNYTFNGKPFRHPKNGFATTPEGMRRLEEENRLAVDGNRLTYKLYADEVAVTPLTSPWQDTIGPRDKVYVVQTSTEVVARCLLMTTDPGDLVLDPTAGSGTTSRVAEEWGCRWIGIDTSRVSITLARERILTATFPYYRLRDEDRGVDAGLVHRTVPHITVGSLAQGLPPKEIVLYGEPEVDRSKVRVSGPFSVEALSRYAINPMQESAPAEPEDPEATEAQDHVDTLVDALKKQGIPRRTGKPIRVETLQRLINIGAIQAEGTYRDSDGKEKKFCVSLGPRFGPITVGQIDEALHDAYGYDLVVFAGFAVTAEAQQYVARERLGKFKVALLEANPDLLVGDLLKATSASQTFRLFATPDVQMAISEDREIKVNVLGVDSFDASTGKVESRGQEDIGAWFLDQDYDGIVFHVNQAFFPRTKGWDALQRALKGTIDPDLMDQMASYESLPFRPGEHKRVAVRVVDDSGTASEIHLDLIKK